MQIISLFGDELNDHTQQPVLDDSWIVDVGPSVNRLPYVRTDLDITSRVYIQTYLLQFRKQNRSNLLVNAMANVEADISTTKSKNLETT